MPVWRLLGGKTRDKIKIYTHLGFGDMTSVYESLDRSAVVERALEVIAKGYRALKVVFIPYTHYTASPNELDRVGGMMQALREAVGNDVEIMIDFHGRCASTSVALQYIHALAPYRPLFVEEPIQPGDSLGMKQIMDKSPVPIAAGERLVDRREFDDLFRLRAINIAQPASATSADSAKRARSQRWRRPRASALPLTIRSGRLPAWRRCISTSPRRTS